MMAMMAINTIKMMVVMILIAKVGEHNSWYISCRGAQVTLFIFIDYILYFYSYYYIYYLRGA